MNTEKKCPKCGQKLRFPKNIGGMLMECPSCGNKFRSDFKVGSVGKKGHKSLPVTIFELPGTLVSRIVRFFLSR